VATRRVQHGHGVVVGVELDVCGLVEGCSTGKPAVSSASALSMGSCDGRDDAKRVHPANDTILNAVYARSQAAIE